MALVKAPMEPIGPFVDGANAGPCYPRGHGRGARARRALRSPSAPSGPRRFEGGRLRRADILAPWLAGPIEHVGSTAVPGLAAKPAIDVMAGVASLAAARAPTRAPARH